MLIRISFFLGLMGIIIKTMADTNDDFEDDSEATTYYVPSPKIFTTVPTIEEPCDYCKMAEQEEAEYDQMKYWDDILREDRIVPHQMLTAPRVCIQALFNHSTLKAVPGGVYSKWDMTEIPNMTWPTENNTYYTVIMTHPYKLANLSVLAFKDWHHWLVMNVPGTNIHEGDTIMDYHIPLEPMIIGIHTHIFWIFKQPKIIHLTPRERAWYGGGRMEFNATKFAVKYGLIGPTAILHVLSYI